MFFFFKTSTKLTNFDNEYVQKRGLNKIGNERVDVTNATEIKTIINNYIPTNWVT